MSSENNNAPDLSSILRTLSAFSNQSSQHQHPALTHSYRHNELENNYEPPEVLPHHSFISQPQPQPQQTIAGRNNPVPPQANINPAKDKDVPASSTITTWPTALQRVMRTVAQNEDIQRRIRYLIQRQHDHERQWWKGREALLQKQSSRKEKKRELDEVLRKVGAPVDEKEVSTAAEDKAEITNYDAKVHRASRQMADAMLAELKALDVPFFCLNKSLIVTDADGRDTQAPDSSGHTSVPLSAGGTVDKLGRLSPGELLVLQKRMLELLQDLCRE